MQDHTIKPAIKTYRTKRLPYYVRRIGEVPRILADTMVEVQPHQAVNKQYLDRLGVLYQI